MGSVARGARLVTTSEMTRVSRQGIHESRSIPKCFREGRALDPSLPEGCDTGRNRMRQRPNAAVPPEAVAFRSARKPAASSRCSRDPGTSERSDLDVRAPRAQWWSRRSTDRGRGEEFGPVVAVIHRARVRRGSGGRSWSPPPDSHIPLPSSELSWVTGPRKGTFIANRTDYPDSPVSPGAQPGQHSPSIRR